MVSYFSTIFWIFSSETKKNKNNNQLFSSLKIALLQEGLFRITGAQEDVRYIKDKFEKGK